MAVTDPAPIITPYRVVSFLIAVCSGFALLDVIPVEVKPWLVAASMVLSLAATIFFNVPPAAPANPSIVARVRNRGSEKEQG